MVTVICRFKLRAGLEEEVRRALLNRPLPVENANGFRGHSVATDAADPSVFLLLTRWADRESFHAWHGAGEQCPGRAMLPEGLELDAASASLTIGDHIEDGRGIAQFSDAFEGRPSALARWLTDSNSVFAFLLAPDGAILARNRGSEVGFAAGPANDQGEAIWDYLGCSDAEELREWLSEPQGRQETSLRLNLADAQQNRASLEASLLRFGTTTLLIGTHELRYDTSFQPEMERLTSDLALMMRESAQQNRRLREANETIASLARTDQLTGLANRRALNEALPREIARVGRSKENLSVIMADLDHFKSINDACGHLAGDQALASAANVLVRESRPYDVAARYGGEEFVLLLPGASGGDALATAERIRAQIEKIAVPGWAGKITVSIGVASWFPGETPDRLIARADLALYAAKASGRNRVEAAAAVAA